MEINQYTREELMKLGIYELRQVGRQVGVPSPTSLKKNDLIDYILSIVYGEADKTVQGKTRGRPAKSAQKSYQKFIDLIDKIEAPKVQSTFISFEDEDFDRSFSYLKNLSKVASPGEEYRNDAEPENELTLKKGIVCFTENGFVARRLKFIDNPYDAKINKDVVEKYGLREDDVIEYLNDEYDNVAQIVKINDEFISLAKIKSNKLMSQSNSFDIKLPNNLTLKSEVSTLIYSENGFSRAELIERISREFEMADYSVVKICYDRGKPQMGAENSYKKSEFFQDCVGDEYETVEMTEAGIERAKFYASIGYRSVLLIDNLSWLIKVLENYPATVFGDFVNRIAKLPITSKVSVVCITGYVSNETVHQLQSLFDDVCEDLRPSKR